MIFADIFSKAVTSKMIGGCTIDPSILLPNQYHAKETSMADGAFLSLLGGGSVHIGQLFSLSFSPMEHTGLLLYTTEGFGTFQSPGRSENLSLCAGSVLFWDCNIPFSLSTSVVPWNFYIFFLKGDQLPFFQKIEDANRTCHYQLSRYSPLHQHFHSLLGIPHHYVLKDALFMHLLLTNILTELTMSLLPKNEDREANIPSYLYELKDRLDYHYRDPFSLSHYEELFSINKYRICREFSRYFGSSPLAYLTSVRLNQAKKMLLTTDLNIYEISSYVGYENVNHFISLFRKYNGTTPGDFKQKALESQSASHSS